MEFRGILKFWLHSALQYRPLELLEERTKFLEIISTVYDVWAFRHKIVSKKMVFRGILKFWPRSTTYDPLELLEKKQVWRSQYRGRFSAKLPREKMKILKNFEILAHRTLHNYDPLELLEEFRCSSQACLTCVAALLQCEWCVYFVKSGKSC